MTMHHLLIDLAAKTRHLDIPSDLEAWLLSEYGWEPCDDLWDADELIDLIQTHYEQYISGELDTTIPDDASLWKDRAETTAFILQGIIQEKDHLIEECRRLMSILDKNGIAY